MIILFTANKNGGILQFLVQILNELLNLDINVIAYIPVDSNVTLNENVKKYVFFYNKFKTINPNDKRLTDLGLEIKNLNAQYIWFLDNSILCSQLSLFLKGSIKKILTIHDAGMYHPSNDVSLKIKLHNKLEMYFSKKNEEISDYILLLSDESKRKYINSNRQNVKKVVVLNLGAHIPDVAAVKPNENIPQKFFLFFGRIDKYKGISNLLESFRMYNGNIKLVIAGNGHFSNEEKQLIGEDNRLCILNRYISDEEMVWLFKNSTCLVLPYLEATQSGIIPIAYKFKKPVIVSNIKGLTQFVEDKVTGFICTDKKDFLDALNDMSYNADKYGDNCLDYYNNYLDWENNIIKFLQKIRFYS